MQPKRRKIKRLWPLVALAALLVALMAQPALADKYWVGPTTNNFWTNANNWSNTPPPGIPGAGQPGAGENVFVTQSDAINRTVLYNTPLNLLYNQIFVDATGTGTMTLQKAFNPLRADVEAIGVSGTGTFNHGSGSNTTRQLTLGANSTGNGVYNFNSGTLSTTFETLGVAGTGTFNHNSGANTVNDELILGRSTGSQGTYNLHGGKVVVGGNETIGWDGMGIFNQYSGSTNTVTIQFGLGFNSTGSGTYNMYGGNVSVNQELIGILGTGTFNQTGGVHKITGNLIVGLGNNGTYNLENGKIQANVEIIGFSSGSIGTFNQTGGKNIVTNTLNLALNAGSSGTYNFLGGTLSTGAIDIGAGGTFNITGINPTISGNVVNDGTVKTTNANVTWSGTFTNNGVYTSDPSTQTFNQDLTVGSTGYLVATHSQDLFVIKNDFINQSANALWNTAQAGLRFTNGADNMHDFYIPGLDDGPKGTNPFAWASLQINGQIINLVDGNGDAGGAQYVGKLIGANVSGGVVHNIFGDAASTLNIYYDPTVAANFYLGGLTYNYAGGLGQLIPDDPVTSHTPLPPSAFLLGSGLLGLGLLGWRRRRG